MTEPAERRRLRSDLYPLGFAGIALLRLHAARDASAARACIDEMRSVLERLDGDDSSFEESTALVDVATGYARWAEVYDLPGNPLVECEEPTVRAMLDGLDGSPVLDAACGTGRYLAYLAAQGHDVIGVDISPEMLAKARQKVPDADLRAGDLLRMPVADGEATAVVCTLAVDHVEELRPAYAEFARVTRPGGTIVVSAMHPVLRSIFGWGAWFIDEQGKTDVPCFEHPLGDHLNAAVRAGLVLVRCEEPPAPASVLPEDSPASLRIAYEGVPMVLVLQFVRP